MLGRHGPHERKHDYHGRGERRRFLPRNTMITSFTHSSGVTTFGPSVTIGSGNVAGAGTVNATNQIAITNTIALPGSVTATLAGGSPFGVSGANLANSTQLNTLALSGGTVTVTLPTPATNNALNVVTAGVAYTTANPGPSVGPSPDTGTVWNNPGENGSSANLQNSSGGTTGVTYQAAANYPGSYPGNPNPLLNNFSSVITLTNSQAQTFTFGGLTPGVAYNLYAIMNSNWPLGNVGVGGTAAARRRSRSAASPGRSPPRMALQRLASSLPLFNRTRRAHAHRGQHYGHRPRTNAWGRQYLPGRLGNRR